MLAAKSSKLDMLLLLIDNGALASIHAIDYQGWTALHYAGAYGNYDICMVLILAGCNIQHISKVGHTPGNVAFIHNNFAVMELFITYADGIVEYKLQLSFLKEFYKKQLERIEEVVENKKND